MLIYTNPHHKANPIHRQVFALDQAESALTPDSSGDLSQKAIRILRYGYLNQIPASVSKG
jgi:hypothetical protein